MRRSIDSAASPRFGYWTLTVLMLCAFSFVTSVRMALAGINVWTSIGPEGRSVDALALDPTKPGTLYAHAVYCPPPGDSCSNGVFKSTDGGSTWGATGPGPDNHVAALAIELTTPTTLYAGTDGGGVFKSTDGARTWSVANAGLTDTPVSALALDASTPGTLYAGTQDFCTDGCAGGVFKSTDGGDTWGAANAGLPGISVAGLAIDPSTPGTLYAWGTVECFKFYCANGVFKSTDGAGSWAAVNTGLPGTYIRALAIDPATPTTLYAGTASFGIFGGCWGGVFKSTDGGSTWVDTGLSVDGVGALAVDPTTPGTVYVGTLACVPRFHEEGMFKSTDGASSWNTINARLPNTSVGALAIDPTTPATLYATDGGDVFKIEQVCVGDCHGSGQVTVDELVTLVGIALGNSSTSACAVGDANHDGQITVEEIIMAVNFALDGCT